MESSEPTSLSNFLELKDAHLCAGSGNALFVASDVVDEAHFAEAVTSCRDVLGSLLDPVYAHAQIFSSDEGSVVFVRIERC